MVHCTGLVREGGRVGPTGDRPLDEMGTREDGERSTRTTLLGDGGSSG